MRSMSLKTPAVLLAATFVLIAGPVSAQDAEAGRETFVRAGCYSCHGYEGQGAGTGPKLAPGPIPYEAFSTFVRQTAAEMPPYTPAVLPEEELRNIHAFLQSIPESPDPADIPLLQSLQ
jgi:mono/diheme cytochrome c family protein